MCFSSRSASDRPKTDELREKFRVAVFPLWILLQNPYEKGPNKKVRSFSLHSYRRKNLSALATSKAWSRVNAAREIVAAGVSGEW